jgi:transketolase
VISRAERANSTVISTQSRASMRDWLFNRVSEAYALTSDWDNRWRTGGSVDEVLEEAHLSPAWLLEGIQRFVLEKPARLEALRRELEAAQE